MLPVEVALVAVPSTAAPFELPERRARSSSMCGVELHHSGPDGLSYAAGLATTSPTCPGGDLAVPGLWK